MLPALPPPPPELDFPAVEAVRQQLVGGYKAMLIEMQAALEKKIDQFAGAARKSEPIQSYAPGVQNPQQARRAKIQRVLIKLGAAKAEDFAEGGGLAQTSDAALRDLALEARRQRQEAAR